MAVMEIGLIRHFKVKVRSGSFLQTSCEFKKSMEEYDSAPVELKKIDLDEYKWDACYSSTMSRAVSTAKAIYGKHIEYTDDLVEIPMLPSFKSSIPLPSIIWRLFARIGWYKSHYSQLENIHDTNKRINDFYERIASSSHNNVLVITHGFFLRQLAEKLLNEGFCGKHDPIPKNGVLYKFVK